MVAHGNHSGIFGVSWQGVAGLVVSSSQSSRRSRGTVALEDLALQERDSVFRAPSGGDWMLLGLVALGLLGTGLYDWMRLGVDDHTGRAVFFGLMLVAIFWGALVYIFKLSMCVLVGPRGISLVRGPWRTELPWRDIARLVERTEADGGQRFRWVVAMARDGRELRVREDMVINYARFRAEVYERYLLWRDHGGTWGASGSGPFKATDIVANTVAWWLFAGVMVLLPGLYFWYLLPETGLTGLVLVGITGLCCLEALFTFLGQQTYTVGPKEITRKRPAQATTHLHWRNVSRIDRTRHPAGGLIRVAIAIGRLLMATAARTDSRFKSFAWSPRVPEYLTLRGEGRHVRIRLNRLARPDEMLAWVEYYERIGRQRAASPAQPGASQPGVVHRAAPPTAPIGPFDGIPAGAAGSGPLDPWANGQGGDIPADAFPTEVQPSARASRPSANAFPGSPFTGNAPADMPPSVASSYAGIPEEDERPEGDSWLWDTNKMPRVSAGSSSSNIFGRPPASPSSPAASARPQPFDPEAVPTAPAFTPPPTGGPAFVPPSGDAAAETPWWLTSDASDASDAPSAPAHSWESVASWEAADVYPTVNHPNVPNEPNAPNAPHHPPAPEYPAAYHTGDDEQQAAYGEPDYPQPTYPGYEQPLEFQQPAYAPYAQPDYPPPPPPEEQGPSEREMFDENLAQSQQWRDQQNWQRPQLPRFGPAPEGDDDGRRS